MNHQPDWSLLGVALGLSTDVHCHLADAAHVHWLSPGEAIHISAGAPCDDLLWVASGAAWIEPLPGEIRTLHFGVRSETFVLPARRGARLTAQEGCTVVQVNGTALAHLRAWDRIRGEQRHETRRRMDAIRRPLMLAGVPPRDLPMLIDSMEVVELSGGRELVREGQISDRLYLMDAGSAEVWRQGGKVGEIGPGELFPKATLDHRCCDATITTRGPARLLTLFRGDLDAVKAWANLRPEACLA